MNGISVIVRSSSENTSQFLIDDLRKNLGKSDKIKVLNDKETFKDKLYNSLNTAAKISNDFSIIIDADILVRRGFIKKVKILTKSLPENCSGFGLKVFDRFYNRPKFRGVHIYRTSVIPQFLSLFPLEKEILRPEKFIKEELKSSYGLIWNNYHSSYVAGLHDFYQLEKDIVYKMFIRAFRNPKDVKILKDIVVQNNYTERDSFLLGIELAQSEDANFNDKDKFFKKYEKELKPIVNKRNIIPNNYRMTLFFKLFKYYGLSRSFLKSL